MSATAGALPGCAPAARSRVFSRISAPLLGVVLWMARRIILTFSCLLAFIAPIGGAAASEQPPLPDACTWGASSMTAELQDGVWVESQPETSGCVSQP